MSNLPPEGTPEEHEEESSLDFAVPPGVDFTHFDFQFMNLLIRPDDYRGR